MAKQTDASSMNRRQQFAETYRITKRTDPRIGLWLLLTFLVTGVLGFFIFKILPGSQVQHCTGKLVTLNNNIAMP